MIVYLLSVGILTWASWSLLHYRWARSERARTVAGVLIVFLPAVGLAAAGIIDLFTVLVLFGGFGVAGAVTVGRDVEAKAKAEAGDMDNRLQQIMGE